MLALGFVHIAILPLLFFALLFGVYSLIGVILKCCYGIKPKKDEIKFAIFGVFAFIFLAFLTGG